ncbi:MAG: NADH/Ubiquinone/plastoquinone (Complex I), partial [Synergistales bacterium 53_16]
WTFAAAATLLSTAVILFGQWYFHTSYRRNFRLLVAGCWAAFLGALFASDWLVFVVFVELSTIALWQMISLALPCGLPDVLGPVLKIKDLVLVSSSLLSRMHGGSLNFYVMVALSFLMVLLSMLS